MYQQKHFFHANFFFCARRIRLIHENSYNIYACELKVSCDACGFMQFATCLHRLHVDVKGEFERPFAKYSDSVYPHVTNQQVARTKKRDSLRVVVKLACDSVVWNAVYLAQDHSVVNDLVNVVVYRWRSFVA